MMRLVRVIGFGLMVFLIGCDGGGGELYDSVRLGQVVELEALYQGTREVGAVPDVICFAPHAYGRVSDSGGGQWESKCIEGFITDDDGVVIAKLYADRYYEVQGLLDALAEEETQETLLVVFWPEDAASSEALRAQAMDIIRIFEADEMDVGSVPHLRQERLWDYLARDGWAEVSTSSGSEIHGRQEEITATGETSRDGEGPCVIDVYLRRWVDRSAMMGNDW